jgi:acetyl esterase/lipase
MLIARHRLRGALLAMLVLAAFAPCAAANVPAPISKSNTVRAVTLGNLARGTLTTKVTFTDTVAAASASTGNTIRLGKGFSYRLRTCVAYHLHGTMPVSRCAERDVDTRSNTTTVYTYAPTVTLSGQPRPTTHPRGYFKPYTDVWSLNGSSWAMSAHSWPDAGLLGAGIADAAQEQSTGTMPANSTVTFDTPFNGMINSAQPDSICTEWRAPSNGTPLPDGVSASHPAFAGAPAYYEVGLPTGTYAGHAPRGIMLVIHGGSWAATSIGGVETMRADAERWRARGWETVNLTYRACGQSAADALWFYDKTRAWFGADAKVCALGASAGGHLALVIGAQRPGLYCAVSQAGPTDLRTIHSEGAYDAATGQHTPTVGGRSIHNFAAAAFGEENLASYSPAAHTSPTLKSTRVLQAFSADDALVPYQQTADLADAMHAADPAAYVDNVQLKIGTVRFAHGWVTQAALDDLYVREKQLVAPVTTVTVGLSRR